MQSTTRWTTLYILTIQLKHNVLFRQIYSILKWGVYESSYCLEDYRVAHQIPPSARLFLPLRKRMYGVLLKEAPKGSTIVNEWCMSGPESLDDAEKVVATEIPGKMK